jgi:hypothetical protein
MQANFQDDNINKKVLKYFNILLFLCFVVLIRYPLYPILLVWPSIAKPLALRGLGLNSSDDAQPLTSRSSNQHVRWDLGGMDNSGRHILKIFDIVLGSPIVLWLLDSACENNLRKKLSPYYYDSDIIFEVYNKV